MIEDHQNADPVPTETARTQWVSTPRHWFITAVAIGILMTLATWPLPTLTGLGVAAGGSLLLGGIAGLLGRRAKTSRCGGQCAEQHTYTDQCQLRPPPNPLTADDAATLVPGCVAHGGPDCVCTTVETDRAVRAVQAWMALDVHQALGLPTDLSAGIKHQGRPDWSSWWAELSGHIVRAAGAANRHPAISAWGNAYDRATAADAAADRHRRRADTLAATIEQMKHTNRMANAGARDARLRLGRVETNVRAFAEDMRTWASPHGVAADYAARLLAVLDDAPGAGTRPYGAPTATVEHLDDKGPDCGKRADEALTGDDVPAQVRLFPGGRRLIEEMAGYRYAADDASAVRDQVADVNGEQLRDAIAKALIARIKQSVIIEPHPFGGPVGQFFAATEYDLADTVLDVVRPHVAAVEEQLAALHQGEEPYEDEASIPTPAQWIWRWNRCTPEQRLDAAAHVIGMGDSLSLVRHIRMRAGRYLDDPAVRHLLEDLTAALDGKPQSGSRVVQADEEQPVSDPRSTGAVRLDNTDATFRPNCRCALTPLTVPVSDPQQVDESDPDGPTPDPAKVTVPLDWRSTSTFRRLAAGLTGTVRDEDGNPICTCTYVARCALCRIKSTAEVEAEVQAEIAAHEGQITGGILATEDGEG
jgi:hypothetical protein